MTGYTTGPIARHRRHVTGPAATGLRRLLAACVGGALAGPVMTGPVMAGDLHVLVTDINAEGGRLMVALHRDGADFPDPATMIAGQWRPAEAGETRFVFADLPPGDYAVAMFHDRNIDGELDTSLLGIPTEGSGFSENATGSMGPPDFAAAAVSVPADGEASTTIALAY